jgi:hypothetical protein
LVLASQVNLELKQMLAGFGSQWLWRIVDFHKQFIKALTTELLTLLLEENVNLRRDESTQH